MSELAPITSPEDITDDHVDVVAAHLETGGKATLSAINKSVGVDRRKTSIARALLKAASMKYPNVVDPKTLIKNKVAADEMADPISDGNVRPKVVSRRTPEEFLRDAMKPFEIEMRMPNGSIRELRFKAITSTRVEMELVPVEMAVLPSGSKIDLTALSKVNPERASQYRDMAVEVIEE